ncbi:histidine kinase [Candidatus Aquiluna sp. IMCC13023]|uniref:sensor histidine kinase n=1 Tax=Candidatus Aquiluna sp. IMCC13023 TaxID=1081644 RepID=UPI00025B45F5|nr:ATP-binding protein [Candidatus Aquiluna sp. IMCC13023]EIC92393.1 histidine kinase [Candidatus Aquiluna sp. IMCC13023]
MGILSNKKANQADARQVDAFEIVAAQVVDVLATAGVVLDERNLVLRASPGAIQFGLVQNRHLIHSALVRLVEDARSTSGAAEQELQIEAGLQREQLWVHARAAKFGDRYVMLLVDDRTEAKRLEVTRRDFVANVSHELKTPIGAISLLTEAIAGAHDDPDTIRKFSASLQKEAARLGSLVQELMQLSRVQGANLSDTAVELDLALVINDAVDRNQVLAEQRGVKLVTSAIKGSRMVGDYEMLTTAVRNLVENAIAYSDKGSQVGIGLKEIGGVAEIAVTDSGIGISEDEQERIFERFYRVDPSRSRDTGGTGLGLSIVKHAASNHKGEVRLFSKEGVGSTFTLRLPIQNRETN